MLELGDHFFIVRKEDNMGIYDTYADVQITEIDGRVAVARERLLKAGLPIGVFEPIDDLLIVIRWLKDQLMSERRTLRLLAADRIDAAGEKRAEFLKYCEAEISRWRIAATEEGSSAEQRARFAGYADFAEEILNNADMWGLR